MKRYLVNMALGLDDSPRDAVRQAAKKLGIGADMVADLLYLRKSIDARKGKVAFQCSVAVGVAQAARVNRSAQEYALEEWALPLPQKPLAQRPVIVGAGPCGLFAAWCLANAGCMPILLERGQAIPGRAGQIEQFMQGAAHDEENNVLFGDGGAGAFSDGKLTARGKDARARAIKQALIGYGAPGDIAYMAKPHIGTDVMRRVVQNIKADLLQKGVAFLNGAKLISIQIKDAQLTGLEYEKDGKIESLDCDCCILATGHSARDVYEFLHAQGVPLENKPFAAGLRIEHRQDWLDRAQYGPYAGHPNLGPAEYALTAKAGERGVYSFCMCPGGVVMPSISEAGGLCVNGMSNRARDGANANAAVVAQVFESDYGTEPLAGIRFQREWERAAYRFAGDYHAPAQRLGDFLTGTKTQAWGEILPSYARGTAFADLREVLPGFIHQGIAQAMPQFDRKLKGFANPDAVLTGVEMRTSAPVRILRNAEDMQSPAAKGLIPAGEGAGYAGGIISAAVDGIKAAEALLSIRA